MGKTSSIMNNENEYTQRLIKQCQKLFIILDSNDRLSFKSSLFENNNPKFCSECGEEMHNDVCYCYAHFDD